jgi:hypothetical protein
VYINVPYQITSFRSRQGGREIKDFLAGVADISFLVQSDGNWTILRWADKASAASENTLGFFLGFYSGAAP